MAQHTIVALFRSSGEAEEAKRHLESMGIPSADISLESRTATATPAADTTTEAAASPREGGFFEWLFGSSVPESDRTFYRRHLEERNGAVLSVHAEAAEYEPIAEALERYNPVGIDEEGGTGIAETPSPGTAASGEAVIPTAREELEVGKRQVGDTRRYRVRRYIIERPAEEQIALRDETVVVERRAPSSATRSGSDPFEEKVVEVTETHEEPVVAKRVVPGEDVVVRKEASDRVETVRDTVRETKVDVDRAAAGDKPAGTATSSPTSPAGKER